MAPVVAPPAAPIRKKLVRRTAPDRSQALRGTLQLAFFALNAWVGIEFYLFVRYYETGGHSVWAGRPPGVEGWLPIASLMNLKVLLASGQMPRLHPAGMFLLIAFLAVSWIFRKSFCGWLCPVGTVSEYLWRLGHQTFGRNFRLPRKLDLGLRSLKYLLLALFLYAVGSMSVPAIRAFLEGQYGMVDDVKMLNFFRFLGLAGGMVVALLVVASVLVQNFWCRYLCPYGALMGLAALVRTATTSSEIQVPYSSSYDGSTNYHSSGGNYYGIWQVTFTGLSIAIGPGVDYAFAVKDTSGTPHDVQLHATACPGGDPNNCISSGIVDFVQAGSNYTVNGVFTNLDDVNVMLTD